MTYEEAFAYAKSMGLSDEEAHDWASTLDESIPPNVEQ
jgi:hypothetical protein